MEDVSGERRQQVAIQRLRFEADSPADLRQPPLEVCPGAQRLPLRYFSCVVLVYDYTPASFQAVLIPVYLCHHLTSYLLISIYKLTS